MHQLVASNVEALGEVLAFLEELSSEDYRLKSEINRYSIGRHLRHLLDFYTALKAGVEAGLVDYDVRHRDCELEEDLVAGREAVLGMARWLESMGGEDIPIRIKTEISLRHCRPAVLESRLSRELCYLANHTIHHLAYMALLAGLSGALLSRQYGLAPATASHLRSVSPARLPPWTVD